MTDRENRRSAGELPTLEAGSGGDDSFDDILAKVIRTPSSAATTELTIGSELGGQFRIERMLGAGGMGTVYVARDQTLGREVAIKVHHASGGALRLRREAIAMARLAHPNVVTVFEVGEIDHRPFVVMEFVVGTTLRAWLSEQPRTTTEILAMLVAAGEGLAAAHGAGLVHRDIKPENVLIGADGRARVGDFGLARDLDSKDEPLPVTAAERILSPMTQTGAVLGTPAYMAPEQFSGAPVDARADQFAFCVTAWEALCGTRPFNGATPDAVFAAMKTRPIAPPTSRMPSRIRTALERGFAFEPDARFASMTELLDALREPSRRRRRVIAAIGVAAVLAIGGFAILRRGDSVSCEGAGIVDLARIPGDLPAKLRAIGAGDAAARIDSAFREYETEFRTHARAACEAGRLHHDWSPDLIAKSDACFSVATSAAASLLTTVELRAEKVPEIVRRAVALPDVAPCADATYLATMRALPNDPAKLAALIVARGELHAAEQEIESHRGDVLEARLARLSASPVAAEPEIVAGMVLIRAAIALHDGHYKEFGKLAADAYYAARAIDDDPVTTIALMLLIQSASTEQLESGTAWARTAVADAERVRKRSPYVAAQLYTAVARLADNDQDADAALRYLANARELLAPNDPLFAITWEIEGAVKMWSGHVDEGMVLWEKSIAAQSARLGPDHPDVGEQLSDYAASLLSANRNEQALAIALRAAKIVQSSTDPSNAVLDGVRVNLGAVLIQAGHDDDALELLEQARAHYVANFGERNPTVANIDMNLASIAADHGDLDRSITLTAHALEIDEQVLGPDRIEIAELSYNLAAARKQKGDFVAALAAARRAVAIYAVKSPGSPRHVFSLLTEASISTDMHDAAGALAFTKLAADLATPDDDPQIRAWRDLEQARALIGLHRVSEARVVLAKSRASYATLGMQKRLDQIDAIEKQLPR